MASISIKTEVPGPKSRAFLERRKNAVASGISIGKVPVCIDRAEGALLTDIDGNTYLDFAGGIGCMNSGHSASRVIQAVRDQSAKLQHTCFQVSMYEPYVALAEKLTAITPGKFPKKACFFNSGAEAVENAIKIARRATGRQAILCFEHAFHGRTLMALSLTSKVKPYKDGYGPFAPEIYQAPLPYSYYRPAELSEEHYVEEKIRDLKRFLKGNVAPERLAAIIFEPVAGEGGFIVQQPAFMKAVEKIARENGIVLVCDEIQTGFARTGKWFACEHYALEPDLITLAKSLSNGFPLSAVVGKAELLDAVPPGGIGGTFGGNPVSCAAALAAIETIESEKLCERAVKIGDMTFKQLSTLAREVNCIGEVRGIGAMIAMEIVRNRSEPDKEKAEKIAVECGKKGLLILTAGMEGNIIRMLMPLCITDEQLIEGLQVLCEVTAAA